MSEMVERVAKSLAQASGSPEWLARAAIEAMREPTEAMYMRGGNVAVSNRGNDHLSPRPGARIGDLAAADAWRTMIDAALGDLPRR